MSEYSNAVFSDSPVAYYRCDEVSGTVAVDDSVNAYNGTYQGVNSYSQTGAIVDDNDTSLLFAGATGALFFPANLMPNTWTKYAVEFWINTGAWQHVILTYDGTNLTGYQNGVLYTGGSWYNGHYSYKKIVTIDHTKVSGSSDLSDFPLLFSVTDVELKTVANGGKVQNSNGYDIIFTDATGGYLLPHEIGSYDPTTGALTCWVRVPTLSHSVDTAINMYIGNSSISVFQTFPTAVWDANYLTVYHMNDNAANTTVADSTSNAYNGTSVANTSTKTTTGQIGKALTFNGTSDYVTLPSDYADFTNGLTLQVWANPSAISVGGYDRFFDLANGSPSDNIALGRSGTSNDLIYRVWLAGGIGTTITATGALSLSSWQRFTVTSDPSANVVIYKNGSSVATGTGVLPNVVTRTSNYLAKSNNAGDGLYQGLLDEIRISNIARSTGWVATEYSNQNAPGSFYAVGAAQSLAASVIAPSLMGQGLNFAGGSNPTLDEIALYNSAFTSAQAAWHYNVGSTGRSGLYMLPATYRRDGTIAATYRRGS